MIANAQDKITKLLRTASAHRQAGNLQEAIRCCRTVLSDEPKHFQALRLLAVLCRESGRPNESFQFLLEASQIRPQVADVFLDLGLAAFELQRLEDAIWAYRQAIELDPTLAEAHYNWGNACYVLGRKSEAKARYQDALDRHPTFPEAYYNLGLIEQDEGNHEKALELYSKATHLRPNYAEAWLNLAVCQMHFNRLSEAESSLSAALNVRSGYVEALLTLGIVQQKQGRPSSARENFRRAIELDPRNQRAHLNLAVQLADDGDLDEAASVALAAIQISPETLDANLCLAAIQFKRGEVQDAVRLCHRALELKPDCTPARHQLVDAFLSNYQFIEAVEQCHLILRVEPEDFTALMSLGVAKSRLGLAQEAIEHFEKALLLKPEDPDLLVNLSVCELLVGKFLPGWAHYESRWRSKLTCCAPRTFAQPQWTGEPCSGKKILVFWEQGLGDTVQFIRYAPLIAERGARVLLECPPVLKSLMETVSGIDHVFCSGQTLPEFDLHVPLLSLPKIFETNAANIPNKVPYIRVPEGANLQLPECPNAVLKVGIVWAGNPKHPDDRNRSLPISRVRPILDLPEIAFYSLQIGSENSKLSNLSFKGSVFDLAPKLTDFAMTASAVSQLDIVITVDTSVAHVAGALGKRTWILLPFSPDWRWLLDRTDSPWYPTARLYRQARYGDWSAPISEVIKDLKIAASEAKLKSALALAHTNRISEAVSALDQLLLSNSNFTQARRLLADLLRAAGSYRKAAQHYAELFDSHRTDPEVFQSFGFCCQESGDLELAEKAYRKAIALNGGAATVRFNLGLALFKLKRVDEAIVELNSALACNPKLPHACLAIGNAYRAKGDLPSAAAWLERELESNPDCAEAAINLGTILQMQHRLGEAVSLYRRALQKNSANAILHFNLAIAALMAGDFETGWNEFEWRWEATKKSRPDVGGALWDGSDLGGRTILLLSEQGIGDTLMFARYVPLIIERNGRVVLQTQLGLKRLLQAQAWPAEVVEPGDVLPHFDFQLPLLSLPRILGMFDPEHKWKPYLRAPIGDSIRIIRIPHSHPGKKRIGLVWAGNPQNPVDHHRSVPFECLRPLLRTAGSTFYSLQVGKEANRLSELPGSVIDLSHHLIDFADTASAIQQLDLVITVDTAVAHLAGALGTPVWLMLPFAGDWRWFLNRSDSPWYSSMRLYRQKIPNDWHSVVQTIYTNLTC